MLNLILADSELELIPEPLWSDPAILKYARQKNKKPKNLVLDSSYHHSAVKKIDPENVNRRGRPDIVHMFMLLGLESILNKENKLRLFIHTRENLLIKISPDTRIPKNYNRFVGLIESLYLNGAVPDKKNPLLSLESRSLEQLLSSFDNTTVLHPLGKIVKIKDFISSESMTFVIGGFSEGDFKSNVSKYEKISIYPKELTGWSVAAELIVNYENSVL